MPNTDQFVGTMMADVARLLRTAFDRRVRGLGLTRVQWLGLTRLYRHPGASQSEFADMMEIEKATAGRLIDRLEAKGWVRRTAQNGDRRVKRIYLTPEAKRIHKRLWHIAEANVEDALADLSARESAQFAGLLGRVKKSLVKIVENGANGNGAIASRTTRVHRLSAQRPSAPRQNGNGVAAP
jgi:DNA-binding MarR family transcriptional regulator